MNKKQQKSYKVQVSIFFLALFFWFMVKMGKDYDYTTNIPLSITINNENSWLKYPPPNFARVEFSGRGIDLLRLNFYNPVYEIDLSAGREQMVLNLSNHREFVRIPREVDVQVKSVISPIELQFDLDERKEKKVPVIVKADLKTENGFVFVNAIAEPESIMVIGPAIYVDTLTKIYTLPKEYRNVNLAFEDQFDILQNNTFYVQYKPQKAEVLFDIQRLAEKEVENVPVKMVNVPDNYEVVPLPSMVTVYVKGGEKVLAEAGADQFLVTINFKKDWKPGNKRVKADVSTHLNVTYTELRPATFELIVQKKKR